MIFFIVLMVIGSVLILIFSSDSDRKFMAKYRRSEFVRELTPGEKKIFHRVKRPGLWRWYYNLKELIPEGSEEHFIN